MDKLPPDTSKRARLDANENGGDDDPSAQQAPVPEFSPMSKLPEETIEKIFLYLDTAKDLHAVSNTSGQFNRILEHTKTAWAFEMVFPKLFPKLKKPDILNCRLVCKKWCKAVDQDLQSRPRSRPFTMYPDASTQQTGNGNRPLYAPTFQTTLISKDFHDLELVTPTAIRQFLKTMDNHTRNPFVVRSVELRNPTAAEDYWDLALSFLRRFGKDIWNLLIDSYTFDGDLPENLPFSLCSYDLIVQILGHLPNLRILRVTGDFTGRVNRSLPALPHLHTLNVIANSNNEHNLTIIDELLTTYSGQLLLIPQWDLYDWTQHRRNSSNLPEVKEISLGINERFGTWRQFCRQLVAPTIAKLNLTVFRMWPISKLLRPLSKNFPSLQSLRLEFIGEPENFSSQEPPEFILENVKTLEIVDNAGEVQYDHLFDHLPRLEYLVVVYNQSTEEAIVSFDDPTQWNLFEWVSGPSIASSDIWTRLTFLKELTLARHWEHNFNPRVTDKVASRKTFTRPVTG